MRGTLATPCGPRVASRGLTNSALLVRRWLWTVLGVQAPSLSPELGRTTKKPSSRAAASSPAACVPCSVWQRLGRLDLATSQGSEGGRCAAGLGKQAPVVSSTGTDATSTLGNDCLGIGGRSGSIGHTRSMNPH